MSLSHRQHSSLQFHNSYNLTQNLTQFQQFGHNVSCLQNGKGVTIPYPAGNYNATVLDVKESGSTFKYEVFFDPIKHKGKKYDVWYKEVTFHRKISLL